MSYVRAIAAVHISLIACSTSASAEKVTARISFSEIQSHLNGTIVSFRQARTVKVTILDEHEVEEWSARRADRPDQHSLSYKSVLGARTDVERVKVEWRFEGNNTLVRETLFPTFRESIRLNFRAGKCNADVNYALTAGNFRFGMWALDSGRPIFFQKVFADDIECTLSEESVS
ncbi:hypothetical protein [Methylobacterium sp. GC_Met_2]|uniref:hypothetical protein n=1 Tax=Methylobacterium sp. GC_Met_2 TaxID=2937376 RepID=UPI00226B2D31|nr:hypothetical protein [Methylobacterium sp. GC_Met_2]